MYIFVYWLKFLALILITNSHFGSIWPISSLAVGGQIGNCLYFFIAGFCLFYLKDSFFKWYLKRIIRIYPALWIATGINVGFGLLTLNGFRSLVHYFIYPTYYHFVSSIMVLYFFYYVYRYMQCKYRFRTENLMGIIFVTFLILYIFRFEKRYYHIDVVEEYWVRFLFFECMLLGAWFRENYDTMSTPVSAFSIGMVAVFTIIYFVAKLLISNVESISIFQIAMPVILFIYIYSIANVFISLDKSGMLSNISPKINDFVRQLSSLTLEIYLGQYLVILLVSRLIFPINLVIGTIGIVVYAYIIQQLSSFIQAFVYKMIQGA